jgi:hypothetical protein
MIVANVSGQPLADFLHHRIFKSLDMSHSRQQPSPDGIIANRCDGYLWLGPGGLRNAGMFRYMMSCRGDAGMVSTVLDLAKWDAALDSDRILTSASRDSMWTAARLNDGSTAGYGLGWFLETVNGHRHVFHPGGCPGAATIISRYPDDKLTIILLSNGGAAYPQGLDLGIARHYIEGLVPRAGVLDREILDSYAGYYNAYGTRLLEVSREERGLLFNDGGGLVNLFLPLSETEFVAEDANRGCDFSKAATGQVTGMTLRLGVDKMEVQRIGPLVSTLKPTPDPDRDLTRRVEAVLKAFAQGGKAVDQVACVTETARKDYSRCPALELSGLQSISFIASLDVDNRGIVRHSGKVSRVVYYKMLAEPQGHILIYLTADGLVTDQDVLQR